MPRKSAAALAVVSAISDYRPGPPEHLTPEQAAEWRAVVGRMPSGWFGREMHALLEGFVTHVTAHRALCRLIDSFRPSGWRVTMACSGSTSS